MSSSAIDKAISNANDYVQSRSESRDMAADYLAGVSLRVLRGICDLNYLDEEGSRATLVRRILDERFGA